jgi:hypothetical protein
MQMMMTSEGCVCQVLWLHPQLVGCSRTSASVHVSTTSMVPLFGGGAQTVSEVSEVVGRCVHTCACNAWALPCRPWAPGPG